MDVEAIVAELSYKPGWFFWVEGNTLIIKAEVLHSTTRKPVAFHIRRRIPRIAIQGDNITMFLMWWEDILDEAEHHEMREFARYKGELIDDPHKSEPV